MLSTRPVSRNHTTKTPSRAHVENRKRTGVGPGTVNGKGKAKAGAVLQQTPFQSKTSFAKEPVNTQLKGGLRAPSRPLLDRTPFPNRTVALDFQTPFLNVDLGTPDSALRPSSTRRHIRVPRNSNSKFETPVNTGNHWDVSEDEDGIVIPVSEQAAPKLADEDDFDEIEYMPPNTLDLPYQPPFDFQLPDYKVLGKAIMDYQPYYEQDQPNAPMVYDVRDEDIEACFCSIDLQVRPIPDDDPFEPGIAVSKPNLNPAKAHVVPVKKVRAIPIPPAVSRSGVINPTLSSHSRPTISRTVSRAASHSVPAATRTTLARAASTSRAPDTLFSGSSNKSTTVSTLTRRPASAFTTTTSLSRPIVNGRVAVAKSLKETGIVAATKKTKPVSTFTKVKTSVTPAPPHTKAIGPSLGAAAAIIDLDVLSFKFDDAQIDEDFMFDV